MDYIKAFSAIPEHLQIILVTGYVGYSIAQSGFRDKERKDELFYGVLVYGLFGYIIYDLAKPHYSYFLIPSVLGVTFTAIIALLWRKYLREFWNKTLHSSSFSNEDNINGVWVGLSQNTKVAPTQIKVALKTGVTLECNDVQQFSDAPFPRYYTDNDGNIAFYVTHKTLESGEVKEMKHVRNPNWGDRITYVTKDEIASMVIRFKKR